MDHHLVCVHPWGPYKKGDRITESSEVERVKSQRDKHFVRVPAPPQAMAKKPAKVDEVEINGVEFVRAK
jgi:hypothetical protein